MGSRTAGLAVAGSWGVRHDSPVSPHPIPPGLLPEPAERGLASGEFAALAQSIMSAWAEFEGVARQSDLSAPSRKQGWRGHEVVARLGEWDFGRRLEHVLADARNGTAHSYDGDAIGEDVVARAATLPESDVLDALTRARASTSDWLSSPEAAEFALDTTSSPLGPLPVLTVVHAMTYQLGVAALDLRPCGGSPEPPLLATALTALVDTTGGLAGRAGVTGSFAAVTPELVVASASRSGAWRTAVLTDDPHMGPTVLAEVETILNVTSGRAQLIGLYRSGQVQVRDLPGMVRLAPVLDGIPGLPPLGAVGKALSMVDAVGGLFSRRR